MLAQFVHNNFVLQSFVLGHSFNEQPKVQNGPGAGPSKQLLTIFLHDASSRSFHLAAAAIIVTFSLPCPRVCSDLFFEKRFSHSA
jgi:hypothetical protein